LIEASGLVHANERPKVTPLYLALEGVAEFLAPFRIAAAAGIARLAAIAADEDMAGEFRHWGERNAKLGRGSSITHSKRYLAVEPRQRA
jgi:hypothetical protein